MLTKEDLRNNAIANFRYVRKELGITMREMGNQLGLPQKTIGAIEEGRAVSEINVYKLSAHIGFTMHTIYTTRLNNLKK